MSRVQLQPEQRQLIVAIIGEERTSEFEDELPILVRKARFYMKKNWPDVAGHERTSLQNLAIAYIAKQAERGKLRLFKDMGNPSKDWKKALCGYFFKTLIRELNSLQRKIRRRREYVSTDPDPKDPETASVLDEIIQAQDEASSQVVADEKKAWLHQVLQKGTPSIRAVHLKYLEECSHREIAELESITEEASRKRVSRGLKELRDDWPGEIGSSREFTD